MTNLLIHHPPFIHQAAEKIRLAMIGRPAVMDGPQGMFEGAVVDFVLLTPPAFVAAECLDRTCAIGFTAVGSATTAGNPSRYAKIILTGEGNTIFGTVDVSWPAGARARTGEDLVRLFPHIDMAVTVEAARLYGN